MPKIAYIMCLCYYFYFLKSSLLPLLLKHMCPSTQGLFYFDRFAENKWISSPKAQQGYTCVYSDAASENKPWSVPQYDKDLKLKCKKEQKKQPV